MKQYVQFHSKVSKLETIVYKSMYSVFTLPCTNGEHVTDQMKVI